MKLSNLFAVLLVLFGQFYIMDFAWAATIAHYEFEGNANDSGGNNYHGTIFGSTSTIAGVNGNGLFLNNGYIDLPLNAALTFDPTDSFSFALWVRIPEITTSHLQSMGIVTNFKNHAPGTHWGLFISDGFDPPPPGTINPVPSVGGPNIDIDDDQWHHLAYVRNQGDQTLQVYHNGLLALSGADNTSGSFKNNPISIGNHLNRLFPMRIDDLYIYDHALSQGEVSTLSGAIPEPSTITLFGLGALGLFGYGWRRRKR